MDEFEQKRGIVKMLLDMLKNSDGDELSHGMNPPAPMPDAKGLEVEKVSVLPKPDEDGHMDGGHSPEAASLADEVLHKGEPADESDMDDMDDESEDMPAFSSLLKKKAKK